MAGSVGLPDEVVLLLRERVESFEHLEILLLLRREREPDWTAQLLAERTGVTHEEVLKAVHHLRQVGLAGGVSPHVTYAPKNTLLEQAVDSLARAYADKPLEVVKLMNTNALERVRNSAARAFADAFLLGKKRRDD